MQAELRATINLLDKEEINEAKNGCCSILYKK